MPVLSVAITLFAQCTHTYITPASINNHTIATISLYQRHEQCNNQSNDNQYNRISYRYSYVLLHVETTGYHDKCPTVYTHMTCKEQNLKCITWTKVSELQSVNYYGEGRFMKMQKRV